MALFQILVLVLMIITITAAKVQVKGFFFHDENGYSIINIYMYINKNNLRFRKENSSKFSQGKIQIIYFKYFHSDINEQRVFMPGSCLDLIPI